MKGNNLVRFYKLLVQTQEYKSADYFALKLDLSTKTIYNYLDEFDYFKGDFNLSIDRIQNVGIKLSGSFEESSAFIQFLQTNERKFDPSTRKYAILEELLMYDNTISIRKMSEKFFVSRTSIVSDLNEIEKDLSVLGLNLVKSSGGTYISGKEQRIRSAKRKYIITQLESLSSVDNSFEIADVLHLLLKYTSEGVINCTKKIIMFIKQELHFDISVIYLTQLYTQLAITLDRYLKNNYLTSTTVRPVTYELHALKTYPVALKVVAMIEEDFSIQLNEHEKRYLNSRISGVYKEENIATQYNPPEEINSLVMKLIQRIDGIFSKDLTSDQILVRGLQDHFVPMIIRLKNNNRISNPLINGIKEQYSAMFSLILLAISSLESDIGYILSDDEISFILIHFQASLERFNLSKKIAIVSDANQPNVELIKSRTKMNIPTFDIIEVVSINQIDPVYLSAFDLVITTEDIQFSTLRTVKISHYITDNDIRKIKEAYNGIIINETTNSTRFFHSVTSPNAIFVDINLKNRKEIINFACNYLENNKFVTGNFKKTVFERESISSTNIGKGIAFPHGNSIEVINSQIVIISLKNQVHWGGSNVDLIFLLAINFDNTTSTKEILKELYYLIKSEEKLETIRSLKSPKMIHALFLAL